NGLDELLPNDITTFDDQLSIVTTGGTPFLLSALDINSTEAVTLNANLSVQGEMSIDVAATDAAQYSALADLVHASSSATIDVLGGTIQAGMVTLSAASTLILVVTGFELASVQVGILNANSIARVSVEGSTSITSTTGGITLGATSSVLAHNVL